MVEGVSSPAGPTALSSLRDGADKSSPPSGLQSADAGHAHQPRYCTASDLFDIKGEDCAEKVALVEASNQYLRQFAAPLKIDGKTACFHCGSVMDGMMHALGVGAAYEWGLAHGEARCSKCGWPARGMHYPKDADGKELWSARNLFLAYHPDQVTEGQS